MVIFFVDIYKYNNKSFKIKLSLNLVSYTIMASILVYSSSFNFIELYIVNQILLSSTIELFCI